MEDQKENKEYSAYQMLWKEKIPDLITDLESIDENESKVPLLKLESTYAPMVRKIDITVFANGEVTVWKSETLFMKNKPEVTLSAQLKTELLHEIKRLLNQETLRKQKSCFRAVMDGYSSALTLYLKDRTKVIHNENCEKSDFSLSYQYLNFLLSAISNAIEMHYSIIGNVQADKKQT